MSFGLQVTMIMFGLVVAASLFSGMTGRAGARD
jgi:hypothetical protein